MWGLVVLVPVTWPFLLFALLVWAMVRFWRVTLAVLAVLFVWYVVNQGIGAVLIWSALGAFVASLVFAARRASDALEKRTERAVSEWRR